jgi:hypothetical protein
MTWLVDKAVEEAGDEDWAPAVESGEVEEDSVPFVEGSRSARMLLRSEVGLSDEPTETPNNASTVSN